MRAIKRIGDNSVRTFVGTNDTGATDADPAGGDADDELMREIAAIAYRFERVGHSRWPLVLDQNGSITDGWTQDVRSWSAKNGEIRFAGDDSRLTYVLTQGLDGVWRGWSLRDKRVAVRLLPEGGEGRVSDEATALVETSAELGPRSPVVGSLPKIFCITLHQTPARTAAAREHFRSIGLDVEFFHGIHARSLGIKVSMPSVGDPNYFMSQGYLGNFLSHYTLWNTLLHLPYDEVLVLEDDAYMQADFQTQFAEYYRELPADWDIVYVGSCCVENKPTRRITSRIAQVEYPLCFHALLLRKRKRTPAA